jgi:hypothetical protein
MVFVIRYEAFIVGFAAFRRYQSDNPDSAELIKKACKYVTTVHALLG